MNRKLFFITLCSFFNFFIPAVVHAADNKSDYALVSGTDFVSLGKFRAWEAFFLQQGNEVLCWLSSKPVTQTGLSSDDSNLITSIRPTHNIRDEISFHAPHKLDQDKFVKVSIDNKVSFNLSSEGRWAWLKSSLDEGRFVLASQNGTVLNINATTDDGKIMTQKYSLSGYTLAYKTALDKCNDFFEPKPDVVKKPAVKK